MRFETTRVLIIDDIEMARIVVKNMLLKLGVIESNIFELANAKFAIDLIIKQGIDIVISDWSMPGMDGIDLLKEIRGNEQTREVFFVMTTSFSDRDKVEVAHNSGITDFLLKPFSFATFKEKLLKLVESQKSHNIN